MSPQVWMSADLGTVPCVVLGVFFVEKRRPWNFYFSFGHCAHVWNSSKQIAFSTSELLIQKQTSCFSSVLLVFCMDLYGCQMNSLHTSSPWQRVTSWELLGRDKVLSDTLFLSAAKKLDDWSPSSPEAWLRAFFTITYSTALVGCLCEVCKVPRADSWVEIWPLCINKSE